MRATIIFLLTALWPAALLGQNPDNRSGPPSRRLSLIVQFGPSLGGPASGLAEELRLAGFDDTNPGGCFFIGCSGPTAYPTQESPTAAAGLTAHFALSRRLVIGAGYSNTSLGGAAGYRADTASVFGDFVFSHWDATIVWAGAFWRPAPALRLGGGPGWYRLENVPEGSKVSQVGVMVEVGAELPAYRRFFLDLAVRAHLIPTKDVAHGGTEPVTLRPTWSHVALLAGLGVRL